MAADPREVRLRVIAALLQAGEPLRVQALAKTCRVSARATGEAVAALQREGLVRQLPAEDACVWAARWDERVKRRAAAGKGALREAVAPAEVGDGKALEIDCEAVCSFNRHVIEEYRPPPDKRLLVFVQCSVRRPFSSSPSHASVRRAIALATGFDPRTQREECPVHVVVLASRIGPVPYELEDVFPANVGGGGVKHFRPEHFTRIKPILAERMAKYLLSHRDCYDHVATFTESRYGEVMDDARKQVMARLGRAWRFPIFPQARGAENLRVGKSIPRKYWEKYWIQLYLEIVRWLTPAQRREAGRRLKEAEVEYRK